MKTHFFFQIFQEAISHLQALEDELVESHRSSIQNMLRWTKDDAALLAMTNEVDYDQDGKLFVYIFLFTFHSDVSQNIKKV